MVQSRNGTTAPSARAASSTRSWPRASVSRTAMSSRLRCSTSAPKRSSGTALTSAASRPSRTSSTRCSSSTPVSDGAAATSPGTTPYSHSPVPTGPGGAGAGSGSGSGCRSVVPRRTAASSSSVSSAVSRRRASRRASSRAAASSSGTSAAAQRRAASSAIVALRRGLVALTLLEQAELALEPVEALAQLLVLPLELARVAAQGGVGLPPADAHFLRLVDRRDEQPEPDRQQLDVEQVDLDVAGDDDALVEHPLEHVGEAVLVRAAGQVAAAPALDRHVSHRPRPTRGDSDAHAGTRRAPRRR